MARAFGAMLGRGPGRSGGELERQCGQQVCGDQCYSPATQTCLQGHVCGLEQSLCGDTCFTPGGNLRCYGGVLCNKNLYNGSCGGVCYNSATQNCIAGTTLCAKPNDSWRAKCDNCGHRRCDGC